MRKSIMIAALLALGSAPAVAQHGHAGGGGGPGGGMGSGPPMTPPGQMGGGMGTSDYARDIASQRGQFGRDFAGEQRLNAQQYQQMAAQHRADAMSVAQAARSGSRIPANAGPRIREALKQDIDAWRDQFQVDRRSWQAMRNQWLADRNSMTAEQWAIQRANWFAARDAWIANQRNWASARRR